MTQWTSKGGRNESWGGGGSGACQPGLSGRMTKGSHLGEEGFQWGHQCKNAGDWGHGSASVCTVPAGQKQGLPFGAGLGPDNQSMALGKAAGTFP